MSNCKFCKNENSNHPSEEHICKKCNSKGLHSYKNCTFKTRTIPPIIKEDDNQVFLQVKHDKRQQTVRTTPFKYNNLFRALVTMMTTITSAEKKWSPIVNFEHLEIKYTVDFTDKDDVDNFFHNMYTDSKIITEEFVREFMIKLSKVEMNQLDLKNLYIELFKNFFTVDPDSLDDRYYVTVL